MSCCPFSSPLLTRIVLLTVFSFARISCFLFWPQLLLPIKSASRPCSSRSGRLLAIVSSRSSDSESKIFVIVLFFSSSDISGSCIFAFSFSTSALVSISTSTNILIKSISIRYPSPSLSSETTSSHASSDFLAPSFLLTLTPFSAKSVFSFSICSSLMQSSSSRTLIVLFRSSMFVFSWFSWWITSSFSLTLDCSLSNSPRNCLLTYQRKNHHPV